MTALSQEEGTPEHPAPIGVVFTDADLDGNGRFDYVVALYLLDNDGGVLRVFKLQNNSLTVAGEETGRQYVGGYGTQFNLIDVNGDGIPEVEVTSVTADGRQELFSLFMWTGSALHDMLGNRVETGTFNDIDHDGVLEIVDTRSDGKGFDIYKLSGNDYLFYKTVAQDPRGLQDSNGGFNYVRAFCRTLEPEDFPLEEIHRALSGKLGDADRDRPKTVHLTFGGLQRVKAGEVAVEQLDPATVVVSPNLTPVRVSLHPHSGAPDSKHQDDNDICKKDQGRISVEVARTDFLKALQRLQFTAPLAAGDKVEVKITARLKDGTPVGAVFQAKIVDGQDGGDRRDDHGHDKN